MIISKFYVGLLAGLATASAAGWAWQFRSTAGLRAEAARYFETVNPSIAVLEKQVSTETQRLAQAEARVSTLRATIAAAPPAPVVRVNTSAALEETMAKARQAISAGRLQEALEEYVKSYRELRAIGPASPECQNLMTALQSLGRTFPPAKDALAELRDAAMEQRKKEPERRELVTEIALLNERLGQGERSIALYDSLPPGDFSRETLVSVAAKSFIAARRYSDVLLVRSVGQMLSVVEIGARQLAQGDAARQAAVRKALVNDTLVNIEILTGGGRFDDARVLTEKLFAVDSSDATHAALKEHLERAQPTR